MGRLFHWTESHQVFVPEIDAEHRNLYHAGLEMERALGNGVRAPQLKEMVRSVAAALEDHFQHEERLMRTAHYLSAAWHKSQHDAARKRVKAFAKRVEAGDKDAAGEMLHFLGPWMRDHVSVADRMMGASLRNQNRFKTAAA